MATLDDKETDDEDRAFADTLEEVAINLTSTLSSLEKTRMLTKIRFPTKDDHARRLLWQRLKQDRLSTQ